MVGPKRQGACVNKLELVSEACIICLPEIVGPKLTNSVVRLIHGWNQVIPRYRLWWVSSGMPDHNEHYFHRLESLMVGMAQW